MKVYYLLLPFARMKEVGGGDPRLCRCGEETATGQGSKCLNERSRRSKAHRTPQRYWERGSWLSTVGRTELEVFFFFLRSAWPLQLGGLGTCLVRQPINFESPRSGYKLLHGGQTGAHVLPTVPELSGPGGVGVGYTARVCVPEGVASLYSATNWQGWRGPHPGGAMMGITSWP